MDPLSVSSAIIGILSTAATITRSVAAFIDSVNNAPKSLQNIVAEVADIKNCLTQLQLFLLGTNTASPSRTSLLMVDQILVTLTTCVTTFSALEETLNPLITKNQSTIYKVKWAAYKEKKLSKLLFSLQSSKTSLSLMLNTLTCVSLNEARASSDQLHCLVHQILEENQELCRRLQSIGDQVRPIPSLNDNSEESFVNTLDNNDTSTIRPETPTPSKDRGNTKTTTFTFTFDQALQSSQVYRRTASRGFKSSLSLLSSKALSLSWSFLSDLSLSKITNVSVLSLPVSLTELWNPTHYQTHTNKDLENGSKLLPRQESVISVTNQQGKSIGLKLIGSRFSGRVFGPNQFRRLYGNSFGSNGLTQEERMKFRILIIDFVIQDLKTLAEIIITRNNNFHSEDIRLAFTQLSFASDDNDKIIRFNTLARRLRDIWSNTFLNCDENAGYYLSDLTRITNANYIPSDQDILRLWVESTEDGGSSFSLREFNHELIDKGPIQIPCTKKPSNNIDGVIYTIDLSEYCQWAPDVKNEVWENINGITKSLMDLKIILQDPQLHILPKSVYLFFTNLDMFDWLIFSNPLSYYFPDYLGDSDLETACKYVASLFWPLLDDSFWHIDMFFVNSMDSEVLKRLSTLTLSKDL